MHASQLASWSFLLYQLVTSPSYCNWSSGFTTFFALRIACILSVCLSVCRSDQNLPLFSEPSLILYKARKQVPPKPDSSICPIDGTEGGGFGDELVLSFKIFDHIDINYLNWSAVRMHERCVCRIISTATQVNSTARLRSAQHSTGDTNTEKEKKKKNKRADE